ncbi:MAG: hypothetical protein ACLQPV_03220 [Vulcanimicrobiaceae bacterium]
MSLALLALTTFLASAVEMVEAATIVLAVGHTQGWRAALAGTAAAVLALTVLIASFGGWLANAAALRGVELVAGPFLVLFGIAWLRKAIWRYAGLKAMHDETAIYAHEVALLESRSERNAGFAVAFQGVFVEGLEVAVIVVTFAASRAEGLLWAAAGAAAAFVVVAVLALALRKPFARVPENAMKGLVGVMLLSLGTFWIGEGLGLAWWAGDVTLFQIAGIYTALAAGTIALRRSMATA